MARGTVVVNIVGDVSDLQSKLGAAGGNLDKFGKQAQSSGERLASMGQKMTLFTTAPIVAGMAAATNAASNLEQSMGAVESIFGEAVGPVLAFGEQAAETAGLSKREVNEMAAVLGASLQGMGFEAGASAEKVVELQKRGADMAATFGGTTKDALDAIASLMRGERDPIEKYGVSIKAVDVNARIAAMGLDTSTAATKKNAEAVAGLDLLMEQTSKTQGQFARESDSTAGAQQRAKASIENSAATLGEKLLPMAASAADKVAFLAEKFGDMPAPVQNAILALGGMVALAGPVLTVVGNVKKLRDELGKVNVSALTTRGGIIALGAAVAGLTVHAIASAEGFEEKVVKGFAKVTDAATGDLVQAFDQVGGSLEIFTGLAEANLTQAVRLRDGLRELGRDTSELDAIIDEHAETQRQVKADTEKAATAIAEEGEASQETTERVDELTTSLDKYNDELADTLGVTLDVREAHRETRAAVDDLTSAITDGQKADETAIQYKDRVAESLDNVVQSLADEVDAMAESGEISKTAASRSETLIGKLEELKGKYPGLATEIDGFIVAAREAAEKSGAEGARLAAEWIKGATKGFRDGAGQVVASADSIARQVTATFERNWRVESPSKVAEELGGYFAEGLAAGIEGGTPGIEEAAATVARVLTDAAAQGVAVTREEEKQILDALANIRSAMETLNEARKDAKTPLEELRRLELEVALAQEDYNEVVADSTDATDALADAHERLSQAIDVTLGAISAGTGLRGAQRSLDDAEEDLAELERRKAQLPAIIRQAEVDVQQAAPEDRGRAVRELRELRIELGDIDEEIAEARDRVIDAQIRRVNAEERAQEAERARATTANLDDDPFRARASEAGLTRADIDAMLASINAVGTRPVQIVLDGKVIAQTIAEPVRSELVKIGQRNGYGNNLGPQ